MYLLFALGKNWLPLVFFFGVLLPIYSWIFESNGIDSPFAFLVFFASVVSATFLLHMFFLEMISYLLGFMMVTDRRIIEVHKSVFLREEMNEIPFERITNLHHEKNGLLENLLNYGTLRIDSNVGKPIRMHFVPNVEEKFAKISTIYGGYINSTKLSNHNRVFQRISENRSTKKVRDETRSSYQETILDD
jgi:hypothetical protein